MNTWINAPIKCKITFDGVDSNSQPLTYETTMNIEPEPTVDSKGKYVPDTYVSFIKALNMNGNEADTFDNPIGIITSNTASVTIYDSDNLLMPSNKNSKYYKLMRYGAKFEFTISYDGEVTWEDLGTYFATSWSAEYSKGGNGLATIGMHDKLQYVSNMIIPKLPAYSGVTVQTLLVNLFIAIDRITEDNTSGAEISGSIIPTNDIGSNNDYYVHNAEVGLYKKTNGTWNMIFYIDADLELSMSYGLTVGKKVKETLNSIAQVLTARVIVDRQNIIRFVPSASTYGNVYTLNAEDFINVVSRYNEANMYTQIEVNYDKVGDSETKPVLSNNRQILSTGLNELTGLKFNSKSLSIENIRFSTDNEVNGHEVDLDWYFQSYQDGTDIYVTNNTGVEVPYTLVVNGRAVDTTPSKVTVSIPDTDSKVQNPLILKASVAQTHDSAAEYGQKAATHINNTSGILKIATLMTEKVTIGDIVKGNTGVEEVDYTWKVIADSTDYGTNYMKTLDIIPAVEGITWSDVDIWDDDADGGIWVE